MNTGWGVSQVPLIKILCNIAFHLRLYPGKWHRILSGGRQRHCWRARVDPTSLCWVGCCNWRWTFLDLQVVPKQMLCEEDKRGTKISALCWFGVREQGMWSHWWGSLCNRTYFYFSSFQATVFKSQCQTRKITKRQWPAASNNVMQESLQLSEFMLESDGSTSTNLNANVLVEIPGIS